MSPSPPPSEPDRGIFSPEIYDRLKKIAHSRLADFRPGRTLDTTALVHESYLRLAAAEGLPELSMDSFLGLFAHTMRLVIVDEARAKSTAKRGGEMVRVTWDEAGDPKPTSALRVLQMDEALKALFNHNPDLGRVLECKYFGGFTDDEAAVALNASPRTIQRNLTRARAWLRWHMERSAAQPE